MMKDSNGAALDPYKQSKDTTSTSLSFEKFVISCFTIDIRAPTSLSLPETRPYFARRKYNLARPAFSMFVRLLFQLDSR